MGKLSDKYKLQIHHAGGGVAGVQAQGTQGRPQWNQKLDRLLAGTGMVWHLEDDTTVVIQAAEAAATVPAGSSSTPAPTRAPKPEKALNLPEVRVIGVAGKELDR